MKSESLDCPNCGASLPADATGRITCRFCNSTVQVPGNRSGDTDPDPELDGKVRRLLEQRDLLEAIKLYRASRGCSLKEAREAVGAVAAGMGMTVGSGTGSRLTCPLLVFLFITWVAVMVVVPIVLRKALETGDRLSSGRAALVQGGATVALVILTIVVVTYMARRAGRLRDKGRN